MSLSNRVGFTRFDGSSGTSTAATLYAPPESTSNWKLVETKILDFSGRVQVWRKIVFFNLPPGENSKRLADALWALRSQVIGWDVEWFKDESAERLETLVRGITRPIMDNKIVILTHADMFSTINGREQLRTFLDSMVADGYTFKTVEDLPNWESPQDEENFDYSDF